MTLTQNKMTFIAILMIALLSMFVSPDVFAAGGLDAGISATTELKTSAYKWLAVVATGYIIYNIVFAYLGRKGWGDVAMAVLYCAVAGAALALGNYAWSIFS